MSAAPSDTLLLCIDLQPALIGAVANGRGLVARCEFAVRAATGLGLPVAFTEQVPEKLGRTVPELIAAAPLAPVWSKQTFSALADETIREEVLRERGIRHLLLCGLETPICVYQTAIGALGAEIAVTLLSDCVGARRPDDARVCLEALTGHGANLLPAESVFYALLGHTAHPYFRDFTRLVKSSQTPAA